MVALMKPGIPRVELPPVQPAGAGGQGLTPPGGQGRPQASPSLEQKIEAWVVEVLATQPHPDKVHLSTHLRACVPALVAVLK